MSNSLARIVCTDERANTTYLTLQGIEGQTTVSDPAVCTEAFRLFKLALVNVRRRGDAAPQETQINPDHPWSSAAEAASGRSMLKADPGDPVSDRQVPTHTGQSTGRSWMTVADSEGPLLARRLDHVSRPQVHNRSPHLSIPRFRIRCEFCKRSQDVTACPSQTFELAYAANNDRDLT